MAGGVVEGCGPSLSRLVRVECHGSLYLVEAVTVEVAEWLREHVGGEAQWFAGALVVESRYLEGLLQGLERELGGRAPVPVLPAGVDGELRCSMTEMEWEG